MTWLAERRSMLCLLVVIWLFGVEKSHAQSQENVQKRSFAELLASGSKVTSRDSRQAIAAVPRSRQGLRRVAPKSAPRVAMVLPRTTAANGVSAATPVTPSGYGHGRDAFVEAIYPEILGRNPSASEVDYWSSVLARGVDAGVVARSIWSSQERRTLVRDHNAPKTTLATAYRNAIAYANAQKGH